MDVRSTTAAGSRVLVSRIALLWNVRQIRRALSPGVRICAVVKADAYGHGAGIVTDAMCNFALDDTEAPAVDYLAVAGIDEAVKLPETVLPVLILRPVENAFVGRNRDAIEHAIRSGWMLTLTSASAADDVARLALKLNRRAAVHVMIDTGMTRTGASLDELPSLLARIESRSSLKLVGLGSHLACGESQGHPFNIEQTLRFASATDDFVKRAPRQITRHVASSGGIFLCPEAHFDMVRPGLSIYGLDPSGRPSTNRHLRPVLRWMTQLAAIHDVRAGTTVGYGQAYTADRDTRVGVVPVGYADGYPRALSNCGTMMLGNLPLPVVGRVSMDYTCVDLLDAPHARVGDEITVLDADPLSPASAYAIARLCDTIPYEILSRIGPRVARVPVEPEESPATESLLMEE